MQLKIQNGVVELSGEAILKKIDFEINDNSRIAVVGRNGSRKTTLLKLISGEYHITKKDSDKDIFFAVSGSPKIGVLSQMTFEDENRPMIEEIRSAYSEILCLKEKMDIAQKKMEEEQTSEIAEEYTNLLERYKLIGGYEYKKEYEIALLKFGFKDSDKYKKLSEFSGGQRTKISFLNLLLSR